MNYSMLNDFNDQQKAEIVALLTPKVGPVVDDVKTKYKLHGRKFSKRDFFRICTAEKINLANDEAFRFMVPFDQIHGAYMTMKDDVKAIYLRSFFESAVEDDLETACHELGHHFLHQKSPGSQFAVDRIHLKYSERVEKYGRHEVNSQEIKEVEADLFAQLLLTI